MCARTSYLLRSIENGTYSLKVYTRTILTTTTKHFFNFFIYFFINHKNDVVLYTYINIYLWCMNRQIPNCMVNVHKTPPPCVIFV